MNKAGRPTLSHIIRLCRQKKEVACVQIMEGRTSMPDVCNYGSFRWATTGSIVMRIETTTTKLWLQKNIEESIIKV